jgi:hypothetical protein
MFERNPQPRLTHCRRGALQAKVAKKPLKQSLPSRLEI